jgi:mannose-6-phosphate isomerase-like protein (cupin superfamily)
VSNSKTVVVCENDCPVEGWSYPICGGVTWRTLLSGDRTPTSHMTVGVAEIAPGDPHRVYPHRHQPPEVYYILAGEGVVTVDGIDHPVRARSTVFIPGDTWHCARNTGTDTLRLLYVFAVDSFADVTYEFADVPAPNT